MAKSESTKIEFGYFHDYESEQFAFYRIPKVLFTDEYFRNLSSDAKVLYGLMLDRMALSIRHQWFDEEGKVLCVIDLDTVMPNFIFSDFGDFLRSAANTGAEDDENLDNVNFNMEIFKAFAKGYLESAKVFLLPIEVENLPYAAALFPNMQCVRFLADYINGDTYYKIKYPEHNLVRTKAQFKLLQSVEEHTPEMQEFIKSSL